MKGVEVPKPVLIGVGALVLVGVAVGLFMSMGGGGQSGPPIEPASLPASRLEDPDPRSAAGGNPGATNNGTN